MDDLTKKTDDELRDFMRAGIANSYVPGSIYNRAKQELEFRMQQKPAYHLTNSNLSINSTNVTQSTQVETAIQSEQNGAVNS
jgi:hypothetical protein